MIDLIHHEDGKVLELQMMINSTNQLGKEAFSAFAENLQKAKEDPALVLILTSGKDRFFSNGLDPDFFIDKTKEEIIENSRTVIESASALLEFPKPCIALIDGYAMGAGAVFAIFCDYRIASKENARIGFPEILIGVSFPTMPTIVLKDLVGIQKARDLLFTGKAVKAQEALEIGLVDMVVEQNRLWETAIKTARKFFKASPKATAEIKKAMRKHYALLANQINPSDIEILAETIASEECQRAFKKLREKTK